MTFNLTIQNESYENEVELEEFPYNEGYFGEKTGFVSTALVNKVLDLGPFFVTVNEVGPYMGKNTDDEITEFFKMNLNTRFKSASDVVYKLNEVYVMDEKNNLYLMDPTSRHDPNSIFEGDFGYILFEKIPSETSTIKLFMKVSEIETDVSEKHYEDEIEFSIK